VTAIADLLPRETRARLLERLDELGDLDRLMSESGSLAEAPEPVPLHRAGRGTREAAPDASGPS
jgi:hypothetical protein